MRVITAGGAMLPVNATGLISPVYAIPDNNGNVFIADAGAGSIVEFTADGVTLTIATSLASPRGLTIDSNGNLYVTESGTAHVDRVSVTGSLTRIGEGACDYSPRHRRRLLRRSVRGRRGTGADSARRRIGECLGDRRRGSAMFAGDGGVALSASLNSPWDVTTGPNGGFTSQIFRTIAFAN